MEPTAPLVALRRPRGASQGRLRLVLLALVIAASALVSGCDNDRVYRRFDTWPVTIDNRTGITLDVYLDGGFVVSVADGTLGTVPDVDEGTHTLEAFDTGGTLRAERRFTLTREFIWILE